jgi:anti-anti-sigma regulatory factor
MEDRIHLSGSLDEHAFEKALRQLSEVEKGTKGPLKIDLSDLEFVDPYGMIGLLELARHLIRKDLPPILIVPRSEDVLRYLERMDFFTAGSGLFQIVPSLHQRDGSLRSLHSDVLLEITRIEHTDDIHAIVSAVRERAHAILESHLNYNLQAIDAFVVALSEICQNIPEHSQDIGYVGIQKYHYGKTWGKNVVKIAVMDLGIGIRTSLTPKYAASMGERWCDLSALHMALFEGVSRHDDPGRGQGLPGVGRFVQRWNGKLMIRSGISRLGLVPSWDMGPAYQSSLHPFPGTQVSIVLPQRSP